MLSNKRSFTFVCLYFIRTSSYNKKTKLENYAAEIAAEAILVRAIDGDDAGLGRGTAQLDQYDVVAGDAHYPLQPIEQRLSSQDVSANNINMSSNERAVWILMLLQPESGDWLQRAGWWRLQCRTAMRSDIFSSVVREARGNALFFFFFFFFYVRLFSWGHWLRQVHVTIYEVGTRTGCKQDCLP